MTKADITLTVYFRSHPRVFAKVEKINEEINYFLGYAIPDVEIAARCCPHSPCPHIRGKKCHDCWDEVIKKVKEPVIEGV